MAPGAHHGPTVAIDDGRLWVARDQQLGKAAPLNEQFTPHRADGIPSMQWQAWLLIGWFAVVVALFVMIIRKGLFVRRLISESSDRAVGSPGSRQKVRKGIYAKQLPVRVRLTDQLGSPAICNLWSPTILFPGGLLEQLNREQLNWLLHTNWHIGNDLICKSIACRWCYKWCISTILQCG